MFGLAPTDCAENFTPECYNSLNSGGGGFFLEPHLGNQNYGQYGTYYSPINIGGGGSVGVSSGGSVLSQILAQIPQAPNQSGCGCPTNIVGDSCQCSPSTNPAPVVSAVANPVNDFISRAMNWIKANPFPSLAVVGGVIYLVSKGGK